jgi:hypothetical protein
MPLTYPLSNEFAKLREFSVLQRGVVSYCRQASRASELLFQNASERTAILPEQKQRERGNDDAQRQAG